MEIPNPDSNLQWLLVTTRGQHNTVYGDIAAPAVDEDDEDAEDEEFKSSSNLKKSPYLIVQFHIRVIVVNLLVLWTEMADALSPPNMCKIEKKTSRHLLSHHQE